MSEVPVVKSNPTEESAHSLAVLALKLAELSEAEYHVVMENAKMMRSLTPAEEAKPRRKRKYTRRVKVEAVRAAAPAKASAPKSKPARKSKPKKAAKKAPAEPIETDIDEGEGGDE